MFRERIIVLANEENSCFSQLSNLFDEYEIEHNFNRVIEKINNSKQKQRSFLVLFFVEYPFIEQISLYLKDNLDSAHYILVAFYNKEAPNISKYNNIFEFINTSGYFDLNFFSNKLHTEIANKKKISLLQFEVKEFYEIGKSLSSEKDTLKLFDMIIKSSMNMTSSDAGTMYLVVDEATKKWSSVKNNFFNNKLLKFVIAKNMSIDLHLEESMSSITKESIFGYTIISGKSLRIDNVYDISPDLEYKHNRSYDLEMGYKTKSILTIPMKDYDNNIMGVIQLINKKKNKDEIIDYSNKAMVDNNIIPFDFSDELIMNSLAGQAAVALENNLLYEDLEELLHSYKKQNNQLLFLSRKILKAHEEERRRIARDIHDGPAQSTANFSIKVDICKKYLQRNEVDKAYNELDGLKKEIKSTIKEIRTIIYDLKPSYMEGGFISALNSRFKLFMESTGLNVSFNVTGNDLEVEYYIASTVYRIVQEALSNIHKHANAKNVNVILNLNDECFSLMISDDGSGFDISNNNLKKKLDSGFGLEGIKERVQLVNGDISIKSKIDFGTTITIRIPLKDFKC